MGDERKKDLRGFHLASETLGDNGYFHDLGCGDVYTYVKTSNCTFKSCTVYCMSIIAQ